MANGSNFAFDSTTINSTSGVVRFASGVGGTLKFFGAQFRVVMVNNYYINEINRAHFLLN